MCRIDSAVIDSLGSIEDLVRYADRFNKDSIDAGGSFKLNLDISLNNFL